MAEGDVGADGVVTEILKVVGQEFGQETDASAFLTEVDDHASAGKRRSWLGGVGGGGGRGGCRSGERDDSEGFVELLAAIASLRTDRLAGEAFRVNSDEGRVKLAVFSWRRSRRRRRERGGRRCVVVWVRSLDSRCRRSRLLESFHQPLLPRTRLPALLAQPTDVRSSDQSLHLCLPFPPDGIQATTSDVTRLDCARVDLSRIEDDREMLLPILGGLIKMEEDCSMRGWDSSTGVTTKGE
jgi:hypothetical protein